MPACDLLVLMSQVQEPGLAAGAAGELDARRQAISTETVGEGDRGLANGVTGWNESRSAGQARVSFLKVGLYGIGDRGPGGRDQGVVLGVQLVEGPLHGT